MRKADRRGLLPHAYTTTGCAGVRWCLNLSQKRCEHVVKWSASDSSRLTYQSPRVRHSAPIWSHRPPPCFPPCCDHRLLCETLPTSLEPDLDAGSLLLLDELVTVLPLGSELVHGLNDQLDVAQVVVEGDARLADSQSLE